MIVILYCAAAVLAHEAGHAVTARLLGYRCRPFLRLPWTLGIRLEGVTSIAAGDDVSIALAGPIASFVFASLVMPFSPELALISQAFGFTSLFPMPSSDGLRAWRALGRLRAREGSG